MNPIHPNHASLIAARIQNSNAAARSSSLEKLATGQQINRASDNPSGLISSEKLRAALASLEAEVRTLQRADHVANTADGVLDNVSGILNRAEELILANANSSGISEAEREANQMEIDSIISSINRTAGSANFNGMSLFDGSMSLSSDGHSVIFDRIDAEHLGEMEADGQSTSVADIASGRSFNLMTGDLDEAQQTIQAARDQINSLRGRIGSFQKNTIATRLNDLSVTIENLATAQSQIRDTDYARETANMSRLDMLHDSSIRNMAMINSQAKIVLNLLG